jgi:protein-S-isoprenylcysteine O-methyltransferase Ste14
MGDSHTVDADRFLPAAGEARLSKPLAAGYLAVVALVWIGHVVGMLLLFVTGRSSWTTANPWIVVPGFLVLASAVGTLGWVDRQLHGDRPAISQAFRMVGLAYGSAVSLAWRRLRSWQG